MYKKDVLANGLRIITHEIPDRDSVSIGIWSGVGGRHEEGSLKGAAHFLEHIVFKGSKKYSCEEIKTEIEGVGGSLNAFTSEEQTCYYAKIPTKHFQNTFDVLADMVFFPKIAKKDVEKEKTVIVEEIKMYHDVPQYYVLELFDELMWPNHPLGRNLAGSVETVMGMSSSDLKGFHKAHYCPENMVISVCGNVTARQVKSLVKKHLGELKGKAGSSPYLKSEVEHLKPSVKFMQKDIEQMHMVLGVLAYDENHKDRYALSLLSTILGGNMSSRLFVELREKNGLAYSISCSPKFLHDTGAFIVRMGLDEANTELALSMILKELNKLTKKLVTDGEFKRAKDYVLGQLLLGLEDTLDHMLWIGESLISRDNVKMRKDIVNAFNKITREDLKRVAKDLFRAHRYQLAIVGPIASGHKKSVNKVLGIE